MENVVHKSPESGRSIGETFRHDKPFEGSISHLKGCLPFISGENPDEMVDVLKVDLGINLRGSGTVQKIGDEGERIAVLFGDVVESSVSSVLVVLVSGGKYVPETDESH